MLLNIDGYKLDHRRQYPDGTQFVYSNWTPRGSRIDGQDKVVFFGLQYFIQKYLTEEMGKFFNSGDGEVTQYKQFVDSYLGKNSIGTEHLTALKELGYVPLRFKALPEGTLTPLRVPMFTVENTHPDFFWIVNYIETLVSCILWMPCTSATSAYRIKKLLNKYAEITGANKEFIQWQAHDFSFRGMPGIEAAILSGMGHLTSFTGTDTIPAILGAQQYYSGNNGLIGGSVAATEHSVMCAGMQWDECNTFKRILDLYPEGIVSIVSDTWNLWNVIENILPKLKEKIMARNGKVVIRPDSGNPSDILCGNILNCTPGVIPMLWAIFGGTINSKGYRELDSHIGVIYGDGISYEMASEILCRLETQGFASSNIVFGIGSYNYQYVTRDTYGFAMKATWVQINGEPIDIFKKPVTDNGEKFSAKGRLAVLKRNNGEIYLKDSATPEEEKSSLLKTVWENGNFVKKYSFSEVRKNIQET